jgi:hypothetical protein
MATITPAQPVSQSQFGQAGKRAGDVHSRSKREAAEAFIAEHAVICLGAALVAGAVLGWFIKRR